MNKKGIRKIFGLWIQNEEVFFCNPSDGGIDYDADTINRVVGFFLTFLITIVLGSYLRTDVALVPLVAICTFVFYPLGTYIWMNLWHLFTILFAAVSSIIKVIWSRIPD